MRLWKTLHYFRLIYGQINVRQLNLKSGLRPYENIQFYLMVLMGLKDDKFQRQFAALNHKTGFTP